MTSFIAKVRERRAEITAQIAALVAERDELDAVERVYVRLSGDGADIAGDEPADQSTGNVDGSAGRSHSASALSTESPASVPVDTPAPPATVAQTVPAHEPVATSPAGSDAVAIPATHLQHDAGDRADPDPHSLVGSSNSPEGASDVAADRARKPSVDPGAEPVRQAGGNASEPEAIPSFLPSRAPIAVRPSGSSSAVITKPMARAPKGTLFYLCDDEGRYLHGSCTGMTTDRTYAWQGSAEQLFNCRKKFPLARDLSERVVSKDMPAPINREVA